MREMLFTLRIIVLPIADVGDVFFIWTGIKCV